MSGILYTYEDGKPVDKNNPLPVAPTVTTASYRKIASADTNLAIVKGSAGKIYSLNLANVSASTKYLKLYNKSTIPNLAIDVPIVTIPVAASGTVNHTFAGSLGLSFTSGIAIAITSGIADTDTTALVLNDVILTLVLS